MTVADGRIVDVGTESPGNCHDLGDVAVLPTLINAHTHLEFSDLATPLGTAGMAFPDWIREVIRWRRSAASEPQTDASKKQAIRNGGEECLRTGTTTIGEIATTHWLADTSPYDDLRGIAFLELLGLAPDQHDGLVAAAKRYLADGSIDKGDAKFERVRCGLSPHAPYTASLKLVDYVASLSRRSCFPIAMHLAETKEELELLRSGTGPFRDLLEDLGAWYPQVIRSGTTPLDYLQLLANAERSLIIHGNYLTNEEIDFLSKHQHRMTIVYCARTHAYFGHDQYPLQTLLDRQVNVAMGTDSRASNPDLSMLNELRFVAEQHPSISPAAILQLATSNAAAALGMSDCVGTLTAGKQADFIVLPIDAAHRANPYDLLFDSTNAVLDVYRQGVRRQHLSANPRNIAE